MSEHKSLPAALAAFQAEMPSVPKGKTANAGSYSYKYADLADIASVAHPLMSAHGLSFTSAPQLREGQLVLVAKLLHTSGEAEQGELPINGRSPQELGSSITYMRRYLFGCLTGVVTDADDDGQLAQNHAREQQQRRVQPAADAAAEEVAQTPPRAEIEQKLDEACEALGKSRAALTKKWRDTHGVGAVAELSDPAKVTDAALFQYVQSLQPYVEQAKRQQQAGEPDTQQTPPEPGPAESQPTGDTVLCDATRPHPQVDKREAGVTQKCTAAAGHEDAHAWW